MQATQQWLILQTYLEQHLQLPHFRHVLMAHPTAPPGGPVHTKGPMHSLKIDGRLDVVASANRISDHIVVMSSAQQ